LNPETQTDNWIINQSNNILITGAAGFVGTKVVERLLSFGFTNLRCLIRPTSNVKNLEAIIKASTAQNVKILQGNLLSCDDCQKAVNDVSFNFLMQKK